MIGHVKIDRKIQKWEWYNDSKMVHLFIHLLINANHKDGSWRGIPVKRGQLITGRLKLASALNLGETEIRTCLKRLKITGEITIKSTNKNSIITICKYDIYQETKNKTDQQDNRQSTGYLTNNQPANYQQPTTNKNDKEKKNGLDTPPSHLDFVCYNVEELVLNNPVEFERIMMAAGKKKSEEGKVKDQLHRYHLWLTANEKYPMGNRAAFAGFEGWLHRGKDFEKKDAIKTNQPDPTKVQIKVG